jgi:hypothetical protein
MSTEAAAALRGALDKAQSVINVLSELDTDYEEMLVVGQMLIAMGAERIGLTTAQAQEATNANVPMLRALVMGTQWNAEDTDKIRRFVDAQDPAKKKRIILP